MAESGFLPRDTVIHVLQTACSHLGISFAVDGHVVTLVKDGNPQSYPLPEEVTRRMVLKLAYRYGMNVEWFWRPEMLATAVTASQEKH